MKNLLFPLACIFSLGDSKLLDLAHPFVNQSSDKSPIDSEASHGQIERWKAEAKQRMELKNQRRYERMMKGKKQ